MCLTGTQIATLCSFVFHNEALQGATLLSSNLLQGMRKNCYAQLLPALPLCKSCRAVFLQQNQKKLQITLVFMQKLRATSALFFLSPHDYTEML